MVDAIYIPSGKKSVEALKQLPKAVHFVDEAFLHCKAIAADGEGADLIKVNYVTHYLGKDLDKNPDKALIIGNIADKQFSKSFVTAIANHRNFDREKQGKIPA